MRCALICYNVNKLSRNFFEIFRQIRIQNLLGQSVSTFSCADSVEPASKKLVQLQIVHFWSQVTYPNGQVRFSWIQPCALMIQLKSDRLIKKSIKKSDDKDQDDDLTGLVLGTTLPLSLCMAINAW